MFIHMRGVYEHTAYLVSVTNWGRFRCTAVRGEHFREGRAPVCSSPGRLRCTSIYPLVLALSHLRVVVLIVVEVGKHQWLIIWFGTIGGRGINPR